MSIIGVDHTPASLAYHFWSMPEKYPQRRHKILKAIPFMVSGVADDETRFDRCGAFCRRGGNTKMSQWLPQRCSPCQSRPLRRGGYFGVGSGGNVFAFFIIKTHSLIKTSKAVCLWLTSCCRIAMVKAFRVPTKTAKVFALVNPV